jgi:signal transduction histidine kinase
VIEPQAPDLERARAELEETLARRYAAERDQLKDDLQLAVENLRLQSSLTADLQMELTTYKQLETQLRRELELTRAELKKFVEAAEAGASLKAVVGPAVAGAHASLDEAEAELAAISQQLAEALDQLSRKERQLAKAQEALTALSGQSKPLEEMRAQLAEKDNLIANLTRQNEALAQTGTLLAEKERQLNDAQLLISELYEQTRAVPALQEQIAEIERAGAERAAEAEQLRNQLAEAQTQLQEKERQLGAAVADLAALAGPTAASPEIAEAQAALEQAREELAAQERQLAAQARDLAAMAQPMTAAPFSAPSHEVILSLVQELRQPMSSIVGYSDLLLGESVGILGALQRKFLERIMASCERMEALLDDLIRVTALDSGKLKVARDSLDVMAVVEEAILGCGAQFREKSINLRLDLADNLPSMFADRDALRQIVSHLLNNAASASAIDGEVTLSVRVQAATGPQAGDSADGLLISVRDSGGGIAPEDQPRVFSRTYRADAPLIAGLGDTAGMGLFIAKALTEAQSGRIWLTSEVGKGSTFSVMLPLAGQPIAAGDNGSDPADN